MLHGVQSWFQSLGVTITNSDLCDALLSEIVTHKKKLYKGFARQDLVRGAYKYIFKRDYTSTGDKMMSAMCKSMDITVYT